MLPKTKEKAPCGLASSGACKADSFALNTGKSITKKSLAQVDYTETVYSKHTEVIELPQKFAPHKAKSFDLAESFRRLSQLPDFQLSQFEIEQGFKNFWSKRAERTESCGSFLEFAHELVDGVASENGKLHKANFCKDRLCPMCAWRRSLKIFGQVSKILETISGDYTFLFLTLTVPNCSGECLSETLDRLNTAFYRFSRYKRFRNAVMGSFRALEITYNKSRNDFHPHFHCILAVSKSYLHKEYIKHSEWLSMWRRACKDDSIQMVNIKAITNRRSYDSGISESKNLEKAVAETCKYAVKSKDILHSDLELTDSLVRIFTESLYHRRLASFSGCFKEAFMRLGFDDAESEDADLTHISDKLNPAVDWLICRYQFRMGVYEFTGSHVETSESHSKKGDLK